MMRLLLVWLINAAALFLLKYVFPWVTVDSFGAAVIALVALYEKRREIQQLQEQNATLLKEVQERKDRIRQLQSNPAAQEEEIRRRYKLLKPGETTFILPDAPKPAQ